MSSNPKLDDMVLRIKKQSLQDDMEETLKNCTRDGPITSKSQYKRVTMQMEGGELFDGKTNA